MNVLEFGISTDRFRYCCGVQNRINLVLLLEDWKKRTNKIMQRLFTTAGIINNFYSAKDLADKRNVHFLKLSHLDVETLYEVTIL